VRTPLRRARNRRSSAAMIQRLLPLAALIALVACQPAGEAKVTVAEALCRPTMPGRDVTACYLTLTAGADDRLVSASTAAANETQLHEMTTEGGVMRMGELEGGLPLPRGQAVKLAPGGNHLMLLGVKAPLQAGGTVTLRLTFEKAAPMDVTAQIGQPALDEHGGHGG